MKRVLTMVGIGAIILVIGVVLVARPDTNENESPTPTPPTRSEKTVEGEIVCLPHKDTDGPQTLECAYGVKLDDGTYYAVADSDPNYTNIDGLPVSKRARLTGTFEEKTSEQYQSVGVLTITKAEAL